MIVEALAIYLPSPPFSSFPVWRLTVHMYALCIMAGIVVGWLIARRRFVARGGDPDQLESVLAWAVLAGVVGARIYHVITDYQLYFGPGRNPWDALKIWQGGLGIWGAVAGGALAVWIQARRRGWDFGSLADVIAPSLLVAQGIGRLGNWFNQELFGRPTDVPWAVEIDPVHRPDGYGDYGLFHPTFAYEMLWCFIGYFVVIWAEKRFRLGHGRVFALYVAWYTFGRSFIERLRIDPVNTVGGFRLNQYTSVILFVLSVAVFVWLSIKRPGVVADPFGSTTSSGEESDTDQATSADGAAKPASASDESGETAAASSEDGEPVSASSDEGGETAAASSDEGGETAAASSDDGEPVSASRDDAEPAGASSDDGEAGTTR